MDTTSFLMEMEDGMRLDESMSEYVKTFSSSVRDVFGEDQDSLIFLEVRDGPRPALQASFVLYEYWQIVFGYEDGVFGFEIPFRTSSAAVLLGPTKEWTLNDLDGVLREVDRRVRLRIPDKYLAAREVEGLRA